MSSKLSSLRFIGPSLVIAGVAQYSVCCTHPDNYTERAMLMVALLSGLACVALAWFERNTLFVYCGSVALAAPAISYSMLGYGSLEMGGWFHALAAGAGGLLLHSIFKGFRDRLFKGLGCKL